MFCLHSRVIMDWTCFCLDPSPDTEWPCLRLASSEKCSLKVSMCCRTTQGLAVATGSAHSSTKASAHCPAGSWMSGADFSCSSSAGKSFHFPTGWSRSDQTR